MRTKKLKDSITVRDYYTGEKIKLALDSVACVVQKSDSDTVIVHRMREMRFVQLPVKISKRMWRRCFVWSCVNGGRYFLDYHDLYDVLFVSKFGIEIGDKSFFCYEGMSDTLLFLRRIFSGHCFGCGKKSANSAE